MKRVIFFVLLINFNLLSFSQNLIVNPGFEKDSDISIFSNSAHDFLTISSVKGLKHINIQSLTGAIVWSSDCSGKEAVTIPVSEFPTGIYIIRICTRGKLITRKVFKNN